MLAERNMGKMPIYETPADRARQNETAEIVGAQWCCKIRRFPDLCAVDWYSERDGKLTGLAELKCRDEPYGAYPSVWLGLDKFLALAIGVLHVRVPACIVYRFVNGIYWAPLKLIDASKISLGGAKGEAIEPCIDIPLGVLRPLTPSNTIVMPPLDKRHESAAQMKQAPEFIGSL